MELKDIDLPKQAYVYGAIHLLSNRLQTVGDRIDPETSEKQWFVLAAVSKFTDTPPNIGDIAQGLGTSRQNIKKMADILERRGFLRMEKDKNDLRNTQLFLTEKTIGYFKDREQQENEYLRRIFQGLDNETLTILCNGMGTLIQNLDKLLENENEKR